MASVKIKFRPSTVSYGQGTIFYQVIHCRIVRQIKTGYRVYEDEWNNASSEIRFSDFDDERNIYLMKIQRNILNDLYKLNRIVMDLELKGMPFMADDVVSAFSSKMVQSTFFCFMEEVIAMKMKLGRFRTAETYTSALNSFRRFRKDRDVPIGHIDSDMMMAYEMYLKNLGLRPNSTSFYMRNLRAVYNMAVDRELTLQRYPFKHVYTGVEKTVKRAIPLRCVRKIKEMDLSGSPHLDFARDMFMFSFYTRGMSFVDMAFLRQKNLSGGILSYRRRKTGQQLFIKWERCMQEIIDKYDDGQSQWLLPIIKDADANERQRYLYERHNVNRSLGIIGKSAGLSQPLTMYVARHAWASIAKSRNVPLSVISEGMGHDSEKTTRIYLASLDNVAIDKANNMILKLLSPL